MKAFSNGGPATDRQVLFALLASLALIIGFTGGFVARGLLNNEAAESISVDQLVPATIPGKVFLPLFLGLGDVSVGVTTTDATANEDVARAKAGVSKFTTIQTDKTVNVYAMMPDFRAKNVTVTVHRHNMLVYGFKYGRRGAGDDTVTTKTSFKQALVLPTNVDATHATATLNRDGLLKISLPKCSAESIASSKELLVKIPVVSM